jgi:hypothetical protein
MSSISQTESCIQQNLYPLIQNGWQEKNYKCGKMTVTGKQGMCQKHEETMAKDNLTFCT